MLSVSVAKVISVAGDELDVVTAPPIGKIKLASDVSLPLPIKTRPVLSIDILLFPAVANPR